MKRAALLIAGSVVLVAFAPIAMGRQLPVVSLDPNTGPAGAEITVNVSQYSPNTEIFVHEGDSENGPLIGSGVTGGDGSGSFPITLPAEWSNGSHLLYICGLCDAQFPEWATRGYTVTGPAVATTSSSTTSEATTTTAAAATTTSAAAATTVSAPPATTAATTSTTAAAAPGDDDGGSSSRGLVIGLLVAALVGVVGFMGFLIGNSRTRGTTPPPPPPNV